LYSLSNPTLVPEENHQTIMGKPWVGLSIGRLQVGLPGKAYWKIHGISTIFLRKTLQKSVDLSVVFPGVPFTLW
jgi:hypothetical protein